MQQKSALELTESDQNDLYIQYGSSASEAMFDFPRNCFQLPGYEGIIPYRIESQCAIVFGEPICPPDETAKLAEAFRDHCKNLNLHVIYIIASERFARMADSHQCNIAMEVCEEFVFDPALDLHHKSKRLQHRVDDAVKHGLTLHEYIPFDASIENAIKNVGIEWEKSIKGPNIFLGHLDFFDNHLGKRWFYVKDGDEITAMAMLSRLEYYKGWLLKFLITLPTAFQYTSEFLMVSILDILKKEDCRFLSKGVMPVNRLGDIQGLSYPTELLVRSTFKVINWVYKFQSRKEYWLRYNPKRSPTYLLMSTPALGINELKALMKVFRTGKASAQ